MSEEQNQPESSTPANENRRAQTAAGEAMPETTFLDAIAAATESTIQPPANNIPHIQNMEVPHHPEVEKKGLKEYLLEGLMIFVAVIMGFIAETIREEISEHLRPEAFAASVLTDLKADTAELKDYEVYMAYDVHNLDTLMDMLSTTAPANIPPGKLYWYGLWGGARRLLVPNDATFQQMRSSGSLRYFINNALLNKVSQYDQNWHKWQATEDLNRSLYVEVRKARSQIFDFKYNTIANNISVANTKIVHRQSIHSFIKTNPPLLSYDKTVFNEYIELVRSIFLSNTLTSADSL